MSDWPFTGPGIDPGSGSGCVLRALLPAEPTSPALARSQVTCACADLSAEVVATVELIVSELVTNAVIHPRPSAHPSRRPQVGLECHRTERRVRVAVSDHDGRPPRLSRPDGLVESGWGLNLAVRLAHDCGVYVLPDGRGKTVWFELDLGGAPNPPRASRLAVD